MLIEYDEIYSPTHSIDSESVMPNAQLTLYICHYI